MRDLEPSATRNPNGSITVADIVNGYRESHTYYGYSEEEAVAAFIAEFESRGGSHA